MFTVVPDQHIAHQLDVDGLFRKGVDSPRLTAIFHGALDRARYRLPRFEYQRTLQQREESLLFLGDPTLYLHPSMKLGWYVGSELDDGHHLMASVITGVAESINATEIVLAGSSGGGFAALAIGAMIPNATILAFSPQTSIQAYHPGYARRIASVAFPTQGETLERLSAFERRFNLEVAYRARPTNRVFYVQNTGDQFHLEAHCLPFVPQLGLQPQIGLFANRSARLDLRYLRDGHGGVNPGVFLEYLGRVDTWISKTQEAP